jgi:ubiquinone/menaquinone biosynthesis C-methylase UbiE
VSLAPESEYARETRERWDRVAAAWERRETEQWAATEPVSRDLIDRLELQPGEVVLELAGGIGHTSLLAAEAVAPGGRVIATDFSPAMVEAARRLAESSGAAGVEHRVVDAQAIDLLDRSVDAVVCRWGLMLFEDPARVLAEVRRVLRPAGRFGSAVWASAADNPWASVVGRVFVERGLMEPPSPGAPGMFSLADTERLEALLRDAGFESVAIEDVPVQFRYDDFAEYWQVTQELGGGIADALATLSDADRESVRQDVERGTASFRTAAGLEFPGLCHNAVAS